MNNDAALEIKGLNKTIGKKHILQNIDIQCFGGEVFGFLGPNGAGKTTTIKIVVGLLQPDEGEIKICGYDIIKDFENAMANVGAIVENPEMYKYLSGKDNLMQYARMRGIHDKKRIDEVIGMVGLSNRINEKVSKYSLGMRQRLGVAQALLHKPKLLILDEPTNGLDPKGIKELRDVLKHISHTEGVCVVVCSHMMSEMELMCDRVGIISGGRMIGTYQIQELINQTLDKTAEYILETSDNKKAAEVVSVLSECMLDEDGRLIIKIPCETQLEKIAEINKRIINLGIKLYTVHRKANNNLEDAFITLTQSTEGDGQIG